MKVKAMRKSHSRRNTMITEFDNESSNTNDDSNIDESIDTDADSNDEGMMQVSSNATSDVVVQMICDMHNKQYEVKDYDMVS